MTDNDQLIQTMTEQKTANQPIKPATRTLRDGLRSRTGIMAIVAVVVLVIGLGYFVWYKPSRPSAALARSLMQTLQLQSVNFTFNGMSSSGSYQLGGKVDNKGLFDVSGDYKNKNGSIQVLARSVDGRDVYAKFNGLSGLSTLLGSQGARYGINAINNPFLALDDSWLIISQDSKEALLKSTKADANTNLGTKLTSSDKQRIGEAYQHHEFLIVDKVLPDEKILGQPSHHYQASINKPAVKAFLGEIKTTVPVLKIDGTQLASIGNSDTPVRTFDAWIEKNTGYISQIKVTDSQMNIQVSLNKYNQPVHPTKPQDAKPFFEALSNVLLGGQIQ